MSRIGNYLLKFSNICKLTIVGLVSTELFLEMTEHN